MGALRHACWQGRGAASTRRPRLRAARALPLRRCTPPPAGAPTARPRRRCALQPQGARTIARPTRTVLRAAWARGRKMPCGARAAAATKWRLRLRIGPQPRPQRPPSGSDGRAQARGTFGAAAPISARPGWTSAPGCASPLRVTGLTMVTSTSCCEPCQSGSRWQRLRCGGRP